MATNNFDPLKEGAVPFNPTEQGGLSTGGMPTQQSLIQQGLSRLPGQIGSAVKGISDFAIGPNNTNYLASAGGGILDSLKQIPGLMEALNPATNIDRKKQIGQQFQQYQQGIAPKLQTVGTTLPSMAQKAVQPALSIASLLQAVPEKTTGMGLNWLGENFPRLLSGGARGLEIAGSRGQTDPVSLATSAILGSGTESILPETGKGLKNEMVTNIGRRFPIEESTQEAEDKVAQDIAKMPPVRQESIRKYAEEQIPKLSKTIDDKLTTLDSVAPEQKIQVGQFSSDINKAITNNPRIELTDPATQKQANLITSKLQNMGKDGVYNLKDLYELKSSLAKNANGKLDKSIDYLDNTIYHFLKDQIDQKAQELGDTGVKALNEQQHRLYVVQGAMQDTATSEGVKAGTTKFTTLLRPLGGYMGDALTALLKGGYNLGGTLESGAIKTPSATLNSVLPAGGVPISPLIQRILQQKLLNQGGNQ